MDNTQCIPIVLQVDPRMLAVGTAGDPSPTIVLQTNDLQTNLYLKLSMHHDTFTFPHFIDHTILMPLNPVAELVQRIFSNDISSQQWLYNYDLLLNDEERIFNILRNSIHAIFYSNLALNPKDCKVIIPEPVLLPHLLKKPLISLLFEDFRVQSIVPIPSPLLCCISSGLQSGLIIDLGWEHVSIVPIYDLYIIDQLIQTTKRGGKWLHYETLNCLLDILGHELPYLNDTHRLFEFVESFIGSFYVRKIRDLNDKSETTFKLDGETEVSNLIRYKLLEKMIFDQEGDVDERSIIGLILEDIENKLPFDCKNEIMSHIIITGELSNLPGLKNAIMNELRRRFKNYNKIELIRCLGSWAGASLYYSTTLMSSSSKLASFGELKREKIISGE